MTPPGSRLRRLKLTFAVFLPTLVTGGAQRGNTSQRRRQIKHANSAEPRAASSSPRRARRHALTKADVEVMKPRREWGGGIASFRTLTPTY